MTGQDLLAAARGDYARILGVLYDNGYYSVVINITLDGVEAAQIAPLDAPQVVRRVAVAVQPGPRFRYSRADIAPVPRGRAPARVADRCPVPCSGLSRSRPPRGSTGTAGAGGLLGRRSDVISAAKAQNNLRIRHQRASSFAPIDGYRSLICAPSWRVAHCPSW